eukprot:6193424-Pleurochrysis_carterae.AAC.2
MEAKLFAILQLTQTAGGGFRTMNVYYKNMTGQQPSDASFDPWMYMKPWSVLTPISVTYAVHRLCVNL